MNLSSRELTKMNLIKIDRFAENEKRIHFLRPAKIEIIIVEKKYIVVGRRRRRQKRILGQHLQQPAKGTQSPSSGPMDPQTWDLKEDALMCAFSKSKVDRNHYFVPKRMGV